MPHAVVTGPASWNTLVRVAALPDARPQTVFASGHRDGLGGTSAGKSLDLARLGVEVTLRTALGDDDAADRIRAALAHPRLTLLAAGAPGPSERHLNLMADDGGRLSVYLDLPPDPGLPPAGLLDALTAADVAVVDLADHGRPVLGHAREAGVPVWCDVHDHDGVGEFPREFVEAADVLVLSGDRLADPAGYLEERVAAGARWAVCTLGSRGAIALGADEGAWEVGVVPVAEVRDTNGAGDAFVAGLLAASLDGHDLASALTWASAAGALAVASSELAPPELSREAVADLARQAVVRRR